MWKDPQEKSAFRGNVRAVFPPSTSQARHVRHPRTALRAGDINQERIHLNPPWMPLDIEDILTSGPNGLPTVSVAHYGKQNGEGSRRARVGYPS